MSKKAILLGHIRQVLRDQRDFDFKNTLLALFQDAQQAPTLWRERRLVVTGMPKENFELEANP
jgi:hypothetical protein